jgi:hypothetical protein
MEDLVKLYLLGDFIVKMKELEGFKCSLSYSKDIFKLLVGWYVLDFRRSQS